MTKYDDKFKNDLLDVLKKINNNLSLISDYCELRSEIIQRAERFKKIKLDAEVKTIVDRYRKEAKK